MYKNIKKMELLDENRFLIFVEYGELVVIDTYTNEKRIIK